MLRSSYRANKKGVFREKDALSVWVSTFYQLTCKPARPPTEF